MAKDINLNSADWCDLIFEGKNKAYGAYTMRQSSSKRHISAFFVVLVFVAFITILPTLITQIQKMTKKHEAMTEKTVISDLKLEDQLKEENIKTAVEAPPPPPLKSTIKFTAPVITDEEIAEGDEMKSQDELTSSKVTISVADVRGTDDEHGVDIQDLADHQVIVEEKPLYGVEQMPQFPGGDEELVKFITDNLKYPAVAAEVGIEGRVTIRFVVNKDGLVSNVEIIRGLDPSCDREAVRVVKLMPKWIPGRQNGRSVPVYFTLPVVFRLQK
jgi:periplasmic protein TonB